MRRPVHRHCSSISRLTPTIMPTFLGVSVGATAPTSGGGNEALITDLGNLAAAFAPIGGQQPAFIASPKQAVKIQLRALGIFNFPVLSSGALSDGVVVCPALP
jgi:hypothetical protein